MKTRPIFICFFSLLGLLGFGQNKPAENKPAEQKPKEKSQRFSRWMVEADVLNASLALFSDRKLFQGSVSTPFNSNIMLMADFGFEKNHYNKLGYVADASGPFVKAGAAYTLLQDGTHPDNRFYGGLKLAASFYHQTYTAVPVKGPQGLSAVFALPSSSQSSYWAEVIFGGRIELFSTNLFLDANVQPRYMFYSTRQEELRPMIVPGFGRSSGKFNLGFFWGVGYLF